MDLKIIMGGGKWLKDSLNIILGKAKDKGFSEYHTRGGQRVKVSLKIILERAKG